MFVTDTGQAWHHGLLHVWASVPHAPRCHRSLLPSLLLWLVVSNICNFAPEPWGFMIQFDDHIFYSWVGEKPPTSSCRVTVVFDIWCDGPGDVSPIGSGTLVVHGSWTWIQRTVPRRSGSRQRGKATDDGDSIRWHISIWRWGHHYRIWAQAVDVAHLDDAWMTRSCSFWGWPSGIYALWSSMASELRDRDQTKTKTQLSFQEFRLHPRQRLVLVRPKQKVTKSWRHGATGWCTGTANSRTWPASHLCLLWQSVPLRFQSAKYKPDFQMCWKRSLDSMDSMEYELLKGSNMWTAASVTLPSTVAAGMTARSFADSNVSSIFRVKNAWGWRPGVPLAGDRMQEVVLRQAGRLQRI